MNNSQSKIIRHLNKRIVVPILKIWHFPRTISNCFGIISTKNAPQHPIINRFKKNNFEVIEIDEEINVEIFDSKGKHVGYHNYSSAWWYNLNCPYAFSYINIDSLYPKKYFSGEDIGHPDVQFAKDLYEYMQTTFESLVGRKFDSILELGTGGGEITYQFFINNIDFYSVEGSVEGYNKLLSKGMPEKNLLLSNLKTLKPIEKRFDITMCTEVAEHIEPFFASKIVDACTSNSDFVWFSAADRNRPAHYHHVNEISIEAWDNIFAYFGFNRFVVLNKTSLRADRLYISKKIAF